ncbi:MAG: CHAT domain-containing tetratricopeptide repeat protein [bacterium]
MQNSFSSDWQKSYDSTMYYFNLGNVKTAILWGEKAMKDASEEFGINSAEHEKVLFLMIDIYYQENELGKTLEIAKLDSSVCKKVYGESSENYCGSLNNLGLIYYFMGDYYSSELVIKEAKREHEEMGTMNDSAYAFTINNLALVYEITGKFSLAEPLYTRALELIRNRSGFAFAETVHNLAALYRRMGKYIKAETFYKMSLELNTKIKGEKHPDIASGYNNLGDLYKLMGRYDEAETIYNKAINLREDIFGKEHPDYAKSLSNLALLYFSMGRFEQAESLFLDAMDIQLKKKGKEHPEFIATQNNLALLYDAMGNLNEADTLFTKSLELYKKKFGEENPFYATTLDNLAKLYKKMGFYDKAEGMFLKAKEIRKNITGEMHPNYARTIFNLAELYGQIGNYDESEKLLMEALKIRKETLGTEHPDYAKTLSGVALLYKKMMRLHEAEPYFLEAITKYLNQVKRFFPYLSEKEKLQYWTSVKSSFEDFTNFAALYYKEKPEISSKVYDNCLVTKGLILSSTKKILSKIRESKNPKVITLLEHWTGAKNHWLWLIQNPTEAKRLGIDADSVANEANELEKQLSSISEDFKKAYSTKDLTWQDVKRVLKPGEAAVEIIRFNLNNQKAMPDEQDTIYYAALIVSSKTNNEPKMVLLTNGDELENKYIRLYGNLVKILRIQPTKLSSDLEEELLKKDQEELFIQYWLEIQKELSGIKTVFLSVDGIYNSINLLTLRNPQTNKYLIDEVDIRRLTNSKDLVEYRTTKKKVIGNTAELFGDPKYNFNPEQEQKIPALPGTREEIEAIANEMKEKKWKFNTYLDNRALEIKVKEVKSPKILHIATHGYFAPDVETSGAVLGVEGGIAIENPLLRSMLFFAGVENSKDDSSVTTCDGKLTAYEAMDLNLDNTEVVVMSACETGLGEVKNGEGVYGLQRAFQVAGARSLIMSLWTVSDEATQVLMTTFYIKLLNGMDKRRAFRETQLDLKTVYPEFYYWGAFVMVGE